MSEYGEPWRYDSGTADDEHFIRDCAGGDVVDCVAGDVLYEDIERIVACVNAMQGIPSPDAVRELIRVCREAFVPKTVATDAAAMREIKLKLEAIGAAVESLSAPSTGDK